MLDSYNEEKERKMLQQNYEKFQISNVDVDVSQYHKNMS